MSKSSFSELLQEKQRSYAAESARNKDIIDDWVQAVRKLFDQLRSWLKDSDPTEIVQVEERRAEVNEPNLGSYQAPRLDVRAFGIWVGIIPKARKTVGSARPPRPGAPGHATGRVDITDEIRRYVLYRFEGDDGDDWFIEGPSSDAPEPLTKERFEEALMSYFQ